MATDDHGSALGLGRFGRSYRGGSNGRLGLLRRVLQAERNALEAVANAVFAVELVQLVGVRGENLGADVGAVCEIR